MTSESDQLRALVRYRLDQAHETAREASILLAQEAWRGTVNRAYYAMFYGVLAVLATRQMSASKHSGALGLFDREFIKPGLLSRGLSRSLRLAFNRRQSYDYGEIIDTDQDTAREVMSGAETFVDTIEQFLRSEGYIE